MSALSTGQLTSEPKLYPIKYLTYSVWFNHLLITKCTNNQVTIPTVTQINLVK